MAIVRTANIAIIALCKAKEFFNTDGKPCDSKQNGRFVEISCTTEKAQMLLAQPGFELVEPSTLHADVRGRRLEFTSVVEAKTDKVDARWDGKSKEDLLKICEANGVEVKGNWGVKRIIEELDESFPDGQLPPFDGSEPNGNDQPPAPPQE